MLRRSRGISQEGLAFDVGIDRTYQSQIECGVGISSLRALCNVAAALGVILTELLVEQ